MMFKFLKNSEISMRLGLNPFNWVWIPSVAYDKPTPIYPKRRTFAIAWLGLQFYIDIDDGSNDLTMLENLFNNVMDTFDESEMGPSVSKASTRSVDLEQRP
jgi:hypothetical protein